MCHESAPVVRYYCIQEARSLDLGPEEVPKMLPALHRIRTRTSVNALRLPVLSGTMAEEEKPPELRERQKPEAQVRYTAPLAFSAVNGKTLIG